MLLTEACEFARHLEDQSYEAWQAGWRVLRIERTIQPDWMPAQWRWRQRYGDIWSLLLSREATGDYARVSDVYDLQQFPARLRLEPKLGREVWPGE